MHHSFAVTHHLLELSKIFQLQQIQHVVEQDESIAGVRVKCRFECNFRIAIILCPLQGERQITQRLIIVRFDHERIQEHQTSILVVILLVLNASKVHNG